MNPVHTYTHDAMKTSFVLRLTGEKLLCDRVAQAGIILIDKIEHSLSRYIEGSEIWQINHMQAGETLILSDLCYECLRYALDAYVLTDGLFDITLGTQIEHQKKGHQGVEPALEGQLMVDPDRPAIHCLDSGREIDLGGIGKGFALDKIREEFEEMGIQSALLSAGASTQLAFGEDAWDILLQGDRSTHTIKLRGKALSVSGTSIQGSHIISPKQDSYEAQTSRVWVIHPNATIADALSTAALLSEPSRMKACNVEIDAVYIESENGFTQF